MKERRSIDYHTKVKQEVDRLYKQAIKDKRFGGRGPSLSQAFLDSYNKKMNSPRKEE